jgi:hypothetical protein
VKKFESVMLSEAKHLRSSSQVLEPKATAGTLRYAQGDTRVIPSHLRSLSASQAAEPLWDVTFRGLSRDPGKVVPRIAVEGAEKMQKIRTPSTGCVL